MTRTALIMERSVISSSINPSANSSLSTSLVRLTKGSTAIVGTPGTANESIRCEPVADVSESRMEITSWADVGRSSGFFSRQRATSAQSVSGMSARFAVNGVGTSTMCARMSSMRDRPAKGGSPVSSSYATQPKA